MYITNGIDILEIKCLKVLDCVNVPDLVAKVVKMKGETQGNRGPFISV